MRDGRNDVYLLFEAGRTVLVKASSLARQRQRKKVTRGK